MTVIFESLYPPWLISKSNDEAVDQICRKKLMARLADQRQRPIWAMPLRTGRMSGIDERRATGEVTSTDGAHVVMFANAAG